MRRPMPTVAIIGPDGAGKTTVASRLPEVLDQPVRYVYMGLNHDASNVLLPTNRLVRHLRHVRHRSATADGANPVERRRVPVLTQAASVFKLGNLLAEAWYRQLVARRLARQGNLVIFDRHFMADYPDRYESTAVPALRRVRHAILRRAVPRPNVLIYLDAPADVLLRRKGEGTEASLNRQRKAYRSLVEQHPRGAIIDANRQIDDVVRDVAAAIVRLAVPAEGS
jgi:thymidylate kinase